MDDIFSKLMLAYVLFAIGFLICVGAFFVCGRNAFVDHAASQQYQADCASEVQVKRNPKDFGACYIGDAHVEIVRQENVITHQHSYLNKGNSNYSYSADLTLPDGRQVSSDLSPAFGQSHLNYAGVAKVEVWNKIVTQLSIDGQPETTTTNPSLNFHKDMVNIGLSILGMIAFGGLIYFFNRRDGALRYS